MMSINPTKSWPCSTKPARDPTCDELMLRAPEATDEEFRALITKMASGAS